MRYLYQKDERALPGNLLNRIYRFFLSFLNKCSVFHYFAISLSLSLRECLETAVRRVIVMKQSPASKNVNTEAEEATALEN
jgi:hypothetical protein